MTYHCLVVEDEPLAAEVLQDYIRQVPFLHLAGTCSDALYALEFLQKEKVDLLFLDIHLPRLKGLDFLRTLNHPPKVILTTAYHEYAVQGYELNVLDYLLKPIEFSRFISAVNKMKAVNSSVASSPSVVTHKRTISILTEKRKVIIPLDEIIYIESLKEYIRIHTTTKPYITKYGIGKIEEELGSAQFIRVHRSFLVSLDKIRAYDSTELEVAGKSIPIGRNYKDVVLEILARRS
jgi:DNA-binding LytR/AlgR family response regulator